MSTPSKETLERIEAIGLHLCRVTNYDSTTFLLFSLIGRLQGDAENGSQEALAHLEFLDKTVRRSPPKKQ